MFKLIIFAKRKPGMTMAEFRAHYEDIHAPLAWELYPQMRKYLRTYLTPVEHDVYSTGKYPQGEPPFDCVTEAHFESREAFQAVLDSMIAEPEKAARLAEDEARLFDVPSIWRLNSDDCE